jgi:hypothetical protein
MSATRPVSIAELHACLARQEAGIACAYLFGSAARGEAGPRSDLDIALLFDTPPPATLLGPLSRIRAELEALTGRAVDLIDLHRAPPDLVHRILRDGVLLLERNPSARIAFEVKARNEYFDLLPYLREYRLGRSRA